MEWPYKVRVEDLISDLNTDVLREISMAEECIRRADSVAQSHSRLRRLCASCAATALSNATALAAEVLSMGGIPHGFGHRSGVSTGGGCSIEEYAAQARSLLAHYEERLAMAERLGLLRLRTVFQDIIETKRAHALHAAVIGAAGMRPRQLS